jgi:hypothetical protein
MAQIRCNLHEEMQEIVENAREMTDWRHYVKAYPLASAGLAAAVGYLVVPRRLEVRSPDLKTLQKLAERNQLVLGTQPQGKQRASLGKQVFSFAASLAVRGLMAYAGQQAGKIFGQQAAELQQQQQAAEPPRSRPY